MYFFTKRGLRQGQCRLEEISPQNTQVNHRDASSWGVGVWGGGRNHVTVSCSYLWVKRRMPSCALGAIGFAACTAQPDCRGLP